MLSSEIKENIRPFIEAAKDKDIIDRLQQSIKEEGVKCLLVVPILFEYLGYNKIEHYKFEDNESSGHSFADITLKDNFLLELKKFGLLNDQSERNKAEKQIRNYIQNQKDNINYGLLTDDITWIFFIDKKYIEKHGNDDKEIMEIDGNVPPVFTFSIQDENFLNIISMFHIDILEDNIKRVLCKSIANVTLNVPGKVSLTPMFQKLENTQLATVCEEILYEQIKNNFKIDKGEYFIELNKSVRVGDKKIFEDEFIYIEAIIQKNGYLLIDPDNCKLKDNQQGAVKRYKNLVTLLFTDWPSIDETCTYPDRKSIIKALLGQQKLMNEDTWLQKWK